ncbi:MAG: MarR family winged helix-turn-helix transcriptional regulator [Microbacterium sp.]
MASSLLEDYVCFALYSASHATSKAYRGVLAPWKLTYTQYLALVLLADGDRSVSELGADLDLDSGTLSPLLKRLEERGLVARRREARDERVVTVMLTDEGRTVQTQAADAVGCLAPAFVGDGDFRRLIAQLNDLTQAMRAIDAPTA